MNASSLQTPAPDERTATALFAAYSVDPISSVTRFPTGLCHYVYEVHTISGAVYVVRIAAPDTRAALEGGLYWHPRLTAAGVPTPALHASGASDDLAYMILERLPGTDLGAVYAALSAAEKQRLATRMAGIQQAVGALPQAERFGFAHSYAHARTAGQPTWLAVVTEGVARSRVRIEAVGRIGAGYPDRVLRLLADHEPSLRGIPPTPFLDDTTTKNVIVHAGHLTGIVDTDTVCFGDPLYAVGLTKMALHSLGVDTDYVEFWLDALCATQEQRTRVDIYAVAFCLDFMSELGQTFNRHIEFDEVRAARLQGIFEQLIRGYGRG